MTSIAAGIVDRRCGSAALYLIDCVDNVGAWLFVDRQEDAPLAVRPSSELGILGLLYSPANIANAHRRAVTIGDDDVVPGGRGEDLIIVVDGEALPCPVEGTLWCFGRGGDDLRSNILERD